MTARALSCGLCPEPVEVSHEGIVSHVTNGTYDHDATVHEPAIDPKAEARAAYIEGLRQLANALEQHDELPLPSEGRNFLPLTIGFYGDSARERLAAAVRALPGITWAKNADTKWLNLNGELAGIQIQMYASREQVCTRRVTGTEQREVQVEVIPAVTRTEIQPVDVVEWDCSPILAAKPANPAPAFRVGQRVEGPGGRTGTVSANAQFHNAVMVQWDDDGSYVTETVGMLAPVRA